jgi:hypothetical protein
MEVLLIALGGALVAKLTELGWDSWRRSRGSAGALSFAHWEQVVSWGWSSQKLLKRLVALDYRLLGDRLTEVQEGTVEQWAPVFEKSPDTWALLVNGRREIVGYFAFVALREEYFTKAKAGVLFDSEITADRIEVLDAPGLYNLYFVLLGVLPAFGAGSLALMNEFFAKLHRFAQNGIYFREVCAVAFTPGGQRLCNKFGMVPATEHSDEGTVYTLELMPWPKSLGFSGANALRLEYERISGDAAV